MVTRLEAVLATIEEQAATSRRRLDCAEEVARRTERLSVEGLSPDGVARVAVDGTGHLRWVRFEEARAAGRSLAELAAAVPAAIAQAHRGLAPAVERLGAEVYGEDDGATALLAAAYRERFGAHR